MSESLSLWNKLPPGDPGLCRGCGHTRQPGPYRSLQLLLRHDDGEREYAYDAGAEKSQQPAAVRNWQVISMQHDFVRVFKFE